MNPVTIILFVGLVLFGSLPRVTALAWEWPQILGPTRNGVAKDEELLEEWPKNGPQKVWSYPVGEGYAGPVVVDGQVFIFHRKNDIQLAESLDAETGKSIWKTELPARYRAGGIDSDRGSKCVPLFHDEKVYLLDPAGFLFCLASSNGKLIWTRDTATDFSTPSGFFGVGSSPIIIDQKLLVNVGGQNAAVVALDLDTGKTIWESYDDRASYSSPIAIELNGKKVGVFVSRMHLLGLDPANGDVLFDMPFGKRGATVNGASPVFAEGHLFVTAAYNIGARWIELSSKHGDITPRIAWSNDRSFSSQYSTPVFREGYLFGTSGREDFDNGEFRCVNAKTGEILWSVDMPVGHTILVGDRLLVTDSSGHLHMLEANLKGFRPLASAKSFEGKARAMPALSAGLLYVRSNGPKGELACFHVGARPKRGH